MGPTWGPSGADRTRVGPMLAPMNFAIWVVIIYWQQIFRRLWIDAFSTYYDLNVRNRKWYCMALNRILSLLTIFLLSKVRQTLVDRLFSTPGFHFSNAIATKSNSSQKHSSASFTRKTNIGLFLRTVAVTFPAKTFPTYITHHSALNDLLLCFSEIFNISMIYGATVS